MSSAPAELGASTVISLIESGSYPREVVLTVARGFLPLPQDDLIAVLSYLALSADEEVSSLAQGSLNELPSRAVIGFAQNETADPGHLALLMRATGDNLVLEALIRNRTLADDAIAELARRAEPAVQDVIVINQARILRAPQILDALLENPRITPDARRRALETREEFFEKRRPAPSDAVTQLLAESDEPPVDMSLDDIVDLLEKAESEPQPETAPADLAYDSPDEKQRSMWAKIQTMTVGEKVQLAFKGDKTARSVLVRERNKLVASAAMRNPRMTESEVESIAGMRNVDEEVLRIIAMKRDWMSKYNIVLTLCRNPKAPLALVVPLINRLTLRDLKGLKDDKGVPEVVRVTARKFYLAKQKS